MKPYNFIEKWTWLDFLRHYEIRIWKYFSWIPSKMDDFPPSVNTSKGGGGVLEKTMWWKDAQKFAPLPPKKGSCVAQDLLTMKLDHDLR